MLHAIFYLLHPLELLKLNSANSILFLLIHIFMWNNEFWGEKDVFMSSGRKEENIESKETVMII